MQGDRLHIFSIARDEGACTAIRIIGPLGAIDRGKLAEVSLLSRHVRIEDVDEYFEEKLPTADIVWFGRTVSPAIIESTREIQSHGKKVVVDLDDDIFNISPWSAHYGEFGVEEFSYQGTKVWEDGVNMDLALNRKKSELWKKYCGIVDAVTVTTPELAKCYAPHAKQVIVLPNAIDFSVWDNPHRHHKGDDVRIFWQGGISHYEDWFEVRDVFRDISQAFPQVKWVFQGTKFDFFLKDIPPERVEFHKWVPYEAHSYKMQTLNVDIAIAPLANTHFNRCKSNIKVLEYSAMRVPCVASDVSPYTNTIRHGADGFLAKTQKEFIGSLSALIEDPILRSKMGNMAYHSARERFDIDKVAVQIVDRFKELAK